MSRTREIETEYEEAIKLQDVLKELNFTSIGEFIELIGGVMGMINVNDIDNVKKISEAFAPRIGYIIDKIGYADKVVAKNKSMREFYNEQQKQKQELEKKEMLENEKKTKDESPIIMQLDPSILKNIKTIVEPITAVSSGGGWYKLSDGTKSRKKDIPENVEIIEGK